MKTQSSPLGEILQALALENKTKKSRKALGKKQQAQLQTLERQRAEIKALAKKAAESKWKTVGFCLWERNYTCQCGHQYSTCDESIYRIRQHEKGARIYEATTNPHFKLSLTNLPLETQTSDYSIPLCSKCYHLYSNQHPQAALELRAGYTHPLPTTKIQRQLIPLQSETSISSGWSPLTIPRSVYRQARLTVRHSRPSSIKRQIGSGAGGWAYALQLALTYYQNQKTRR